MIAACGIVGGMAVCPPIMHKLSPFSLSRLRILAERGPRYYRSDSRIRLLETKGLTIATGRVDADARMVEHRITDAGHAELAVRYGP